MANSVVARMSFSFKGEEYNPSLKLDLDAIMSRDGLLPNIRVALALKNKIDTYSYLYEVMESSDVYFEDAEGLAKNCIEEGQFDLQKFESLWRSEKIFDDLQALAKKHMGCADLNSDANLKAALFDAYHKGQSDK